MKYLIHILLLLISSLSFAQKMELKEIKKINLIDYQNNSYNNYYVTEYSIVSENDIWNQYQMRQDYFFKFRKLDDTLALQKTEEKIFIRNIPEDSIQILLNYVNDAKPNYLDLRECGIDSTWIEENTDTIYQTYLKKRSLKTKPDKNFILEQIQNQELYYNFFVMGSWTGDYPTCAIQIVSHTQDTLHIVSHGQKLFMMPWQIYKNQKKKKYYYNPLISKWLGSLVKFNKGYSNKKRLLASELDQSLRERLVSNIIYKEYFWVKKQDIPLDSLKLGSTKHFYSNTQLRNWENSWSVKFIKKGSEEYLQIIESHKGLKFSSEVKIVPHIAYESKLYEIQAEVKNILSEIAKQDILLRNLALIDHIKVSEDTHSYTLSKDHKLLGKKMSSEDLCILAVYEKNDRVSYWLYHDHKLVLWKYPKEGVLDLKNLKGIPRFNTDKYRILLEQIN